jgi:D-inositol-3-phosphate glycosyltransferase
MPDAPLRIAVIALHTSPFAAPGSGDVGGMNVLVRATSEAFAAAGHHVEVITRRFGPDLPAIATLDSGVVLRFLDAGPASPRPKGDHEAFIPAFRAALDAIGAVDVVHSHHWFAGMAGLPFARTRGVPHVQSFHSIAADPSTDPDAGFGAGERPESPGRLDGERMLARDSDALVAVSHAEEHTIVERLGADPSRVSVVLPGVDTTLFHSGDRRTHPRPYVLTAARIEPLKGLDLAIRAVAGIRPDVRPDLVIAGGPTVGFEEHFDELRRLATGLGIADRVRFAGPQSRVQLAELLAHASAALIPSHSETYGLVALEAAASGVPVLAADSGGLREAVGGHTAALLTTRDAAAWSERLEALLTDDALWRRRSDEGRRFARSRSWERTAAETVDLYRDVIAEYAECAAPGHADSRSFKESHVAPDSAPDSAGRFIGNRPAVPPELSRAAAASGLLGDERSPLAGARTVLFVHAHPDDESLSSGGLILDLVDAGVRVALLTATRGERGEVVPAVRSGVPTGPDGEPDPDALTRVRLAELASAVGRLGVTEAALLGQPPARVPGLPPRRYRDSGMRWLPPDDTGRVLAGPALDVETTALTSAPLDEVANDVMAYLNHIRPDAVVSYDDLGGYGHPDHRFIRAAALRASRAVGLPFVELVPPDAPGAWVADSTGQTEGIRSALRSHATQLTVEGTDVVHSGGQREPILTVVGLRRVAGTSPAAP